MISGERLQSMESTHNTEMVPWLVTPDKVMSVVERIVAEADPWAVYLFGSFVRGQIDRDSDLDVLVVVDDGVENCRMEAARLRAGFGHILMPVDLLVVRKKDFVRLKDQQGMIYHDCITEGRKVYERN